MKAARLFGPGDLRVVEVEMPRPAPDEVVVQVARFAPYGTDVSLYLNKGGRYATDYPVGIGADFSGIVVEVGADVRGFEPGDRVSALAMEHCGHCRNCRRGRTNLCLNADPAPTARQVCCQTHTTVAARKLETLPAGVAFEDAAMLTGVVTALNAFEIVRPAPGETVAVVGTGAMGWGTIAVARALGLATVAIGGNRRRAALARALGADPVFETSAHDESAADRVLADVPEGFACIVETTATDWGLRESAQIAGSGAHIAVIGGGAVPLSGWQLVSKELSVHGIRGGYQQEAALRLIAAGRIDLKPTITHRFGLDDVPEAFRLLSGPALQDVGRVMVEIDPRLH